MLLWVREELDRASRIEHRSLRVHEVGSTSISAAHEYEHRDPCRSGEDFEYSERPGGWIIAVRGRAASR